MHMDKSRIRLGFICIKLSLDTCRVHFINTFAKDTYFPYIRVILKKGFVTILSVAEPFVPTTHGR